MVKQFITTENQTAYLRKLANELLRTADVIEGKQGSSKIDNKTFKKALINTAYTMYGGNIRSSGYCLLGVQNILKAVGIGIKTVPCAYMFPDAIKNSFSFNDQYSIASDVKFKFDKIPQGSIIVFDRTKEHPYGHIEIKVYGTAFISDYIQFKRTRYWNKTSPDLIYLLK